MFVVAIIGLLASMALPLYQDYLIRSRVTEGMNLATPAKHIVSQNAAEGARFSSTYSQPAPSSNVSSIAIDDTNGQITISFTPRAGGGTIVFAPASSGVALSGTATGSVVPTGGSITWDCATFGTQALKYRPAVCRNQ